jgi:hypothetical protein
MCFLRLCDALVASDQSQKKVSDDINVPHHRITFSAYVVSSSFSPFRMALLDTLVSLVRVCCA